MPLYSSFNFIQKAKVTLCRESVVIVKMFSNPKGLLQHCTGEVFLITEANVWEIAVDSKGISFPKKIFSGDFYLIDHPCVFVNENFLYFAQYFY